MTISVPAMSTVTSVSTSSTRNSANGPSSRHCPTTLTVRSNSSLGPFFTRLDDHPSLSSMTSAPITSTDDPPIYRHPGKPSSSHSTSPTSPLDDSTFSSSSPSHRDPDPHLHPHSHNTSQPPSHFLLTSPQSNGLPRPYIPVRHPPRLSSITSSSHLPHQSSSTQSNQSSLPSLPLDLPPTLLNAAAFFSPSTSSPSPSQDHSPHLPASTISNPTASPHSVSSPVPSTIPISSNPFTRPSTELSILSRSSSDAHHQSSFSLLARRHFSKLTTAVASVQSKDIDCDSVISEPASYSNSTVVASDLWLVQRDVQPVERELAEKDRRRQLRPTVRGPTSADCRRARVSSAYPAPCFTRDYLPPSSDKSITESLASLRSNYVEIRGEYERDADLDHADYCQLRDKHVDADPVIKSVLSVPSLRTSFDGDVSCNQKAAVFSDGEDEESPSSLLVSQYFSGAVAGFGSRRLDDQDRTEFRADGTTFHRKLPERCTGRQTRRFGLSSGRHDLSQTLRQTARAAQFVDDASQDESKRRVSRARRIRWWLRRVSHRFRMEAEHL